MQETSAPESTLACVLTTRRVCSSGKRDTEIRIDRAEDTCTARTEADCQVRVYSGKGSGQVRTETDGGQGQRAGQEISPAGVGDRLDSTTKDNER